MTDDSTFTYCFCSPMTHFDSLPICYCDSVLVLIVLTHYDSILYLDSGWVIYCTLTHNESWTYCSVTLIVTWLIILRYYKYRRLWSLRPQTWLLVSYGTTVQEYHHSFTPSLPSLIPLKVFLISPKRLQGVTTRHQKLPKSSSDLVLTEPDP